MGIMSNLKGMHEAVVADTDNGSVKKLGKNLADHAVAAILKGFGSTEWKKYMGLFADNEEQLKRLTEVGPNDSAYYLESRAYIVANAVCGAGTTGQTGQDVNPDFGKPPAGPVAAKFDEVDEQFIAAHRPFVW